MTDAGLERRVAEHLLQEKREDEEQPERRGSCREHRQVGRTHAAQRERGQRDEWRLVNQKRTLPVRLAS